MVFRKREIWNIEIPAPNEMIAAQRAGLTP